MRRFIFILMIALLPLRSWMGEAMATEMSALQLVQVQPDHAHLHGHHIAPDLIATQAYDTPATGIFSHETAAFNAMQTAQPTDCATHVGDDASATLAHSCNNCHACHAVGLSATVQAFSAAAPVHTLPHLAVSFFASADIALGQKPPIL